MIIYRGERLRPRPSGALASKVDTFSTPQMALAL